MHKLISVFVCGVQKGGTTSLHAHFCEHPRLSRPHRKELHFFDDETRDWGVPNYTALDSSFHADDGDRLRFEITPIYSFWPPSIERIRSYNPAAKLVFLFRDPFERAWSQWRHEYTLGNETLPFAEAIRGGRSRMEGLPTLARERRVYSYVERGLYGEQVQRVLAHFPREQALFLRSADLRDDHVATLARIASFLGIAPFPNTGPKREHVRRPDIAFPSVPTDADRAHIAGIVRDDIGKFSIMTGLDVTDWPTMQFASHPVTRPRQSARDWSSTRPDSLDLIGPEFDSSNSEPASRTLIICSAHRTGSYELCRYLTAAGIGVPHEYFHADFSRLLAERWAIANNPLSETQLGQYIALLRRRRGRNGVFATKLQYAQFESSLKNYHGASLFDGACVVHLFRPDVAGQYASLRAARKSGIWDFSQRQTTVPVAP